METEDRRTVGTGSRVAALALVDEGFLDRDAGIYWRAGGRVDV